MGNQPYRFTQSAKRTAFWFTSVGPAGSIRKRIEFQDLEFLIGDNPVYNLAFGDVGDDGEIDDTVNSNNGDIIRIMSTVIAAINDFTERYPDRFVLFTGSNEQRTRFYNTILRRKQHDLAAGFAIYGAIMSTDGMSEVEPFDVQQTYDAFLVLRKLKDEQRG